MNLLMINIILLVFSITAGACIGSFANVLIYRIPRNIQFVKGTSFCPSCGKRVQPHDLIPVLSYIILRGKCRHCKTRISIKYPLVELLGGGLAVAAVLSHGYNVPAVICFFIFIILAVISFIDAENMIIPDGLVIALLIVSIIYIALTWNTADISILSHILGFAVLSVPMYILMMFIDGAFGGGDVKLSAVCGLLLGFKLILLAGFIAVLLGGFRGIQIRYIMKDKESSHLSFGQYICIGVVVAMLFGEKIIDMYLSLVF